MKLPAALILIAASAFLASAAEAHRSGCHRWHSCPSDTGSYVCGDLGYSRFCPKGLTVRPKAARKSGPSGAAKTAPARLSGMARVIDGDTIDIAGQRIRLHAIDAPETKQTCRAEGRTYRCGRDATIALAGKIGQRPVSCHRKDTDRYGRAVAVCWIAAENLNAWMVWQGWAVAYRRFSKDYVLHENAAREARRGIWKGKFIAPWDWGRRGKRLAATDARSGTCPIKGNIGRRGERIYHLPGGQYYTRTKINRSKGERWFCTEAEAKAAGWRRSRR